MDKIHSNDESTAVDVNGVTADASSDDVVSPFLESNQANGLHQLIQSAAPTQHDGMLPDHNSYLLANNEDKSELDADDVEKLLGEPAAIPHADKNSHNTNDSDNIDISTDEKVISVENTQAEPKKQNEPKISTTSKMRIGEKLIDLGIISDDQLQIALQEQRQSKELIGSIMVSMEFLTESALAEVLAESSGIERFDASGAMLDPQVLSLITKEIAIRNKVIPIALKDNILHLAMADVYDVIAVDQVRRHLPNVDDILPFFCTDTEIQELINQYYAYEISISGILNEIETGIRDKDADSILNGSETGYVNPTVRLIDALLIDAIKSGASDIHLEPEGAFLRLRYRIDGQMQQVRSFHRDYWSAMLVRIKIISDMNIAETRTPQDGRISFTFMGRDVDFRVATQPTVHGENVVMRLLDKTKALLPLDSLGFTEHNSQLLKKMLKRPEGIIIVTGPTGSGKTTTLYSILNYINSIDVNIMTLEDPVEYQLPLIRQTNVKEGVMDFLSGIKSLMRQDPDIIFIGEVRDEETALMAVRAAMTGHQVFTTLHTNDALGAIPRLNDIGVPSHLLAGSLICTVAQRLARKLCGNCKEPYTASEDDCKILGVDSSNPPEIYRSKGCESCGNKGYKGRLAIIEILPVDKGMDELITADSPRSVLLEHSLKHGFVPMADDGIHKIMAGDMDVKELINRIDMTERM